MKWPWPKFLQKVGNRRLHGASKYCGDCLFITTRSTRKISERRGYGFEPRMSPAQIRKVLQAIREHRKQPL